MRRRTMLFMPGNNPGMLIHADVHGADGVIFDLEDAVPPGEKDAARILVKNALKSMAYASDRLVRINDISTPYWRDDLDAVVPQGPDTLVLPKCERPEDIRTLDGYVTAIEE